MSNLKVPQELIDCQTWFGGVMARPLSDALQMQTEGLTCDSLAVEAGKYLRGNAALDAFGRMQVYNRQYWFRLITVMQADYTCSIHVMGLRNFNLWVIRYLENNPPDSPYLNVLDQRFIAFMEMAYNQSDRDTVLEAIAYDGAFARAFDGPLGQPLQPSALQGTDLMTVSLRLAPHVTPLHLTHRWKSYRASVLDDESLEQIVVPPEPGRWTVLIYRNDFILYEKEIATAAYHVLHALKEPGTLPEILDRIPELNEVESADLEAHLIEWFRDFVAQGWVVAGEAVPE
jgi:hypothetical protein